MVLNFNQVTIILSALLTMDSYVSAFWWANEEPTKPASSRASSPSNYPHSSYVQGGYPGGSYSISQNYPMNNGFSGPSYSSQSAWAGSWPPRPFYDYNQGTSIPSVPILPIQVPMQTGFGSAHIQNVQLVPCLCPVTTEYGYDFPQSAQQVAPSLPAQSEGDKPHSRKMFGRSQQVVPPIVKKTSSVET